MTTTSTYQLRLSAQEKDETFAVFRAMGLKPAQAVRLFFGQVRATKRLPFAVAKAATSVENAAGVPNAQTCQVLAETDAGIDWHRAKDAKDLFKQLGQETTAAKRIEHVPNAKTLKAFQNSEAGMGLTAFDSTEAMFAHLDALVK